PHTTCTTASFRQTFVRHYLPQLHRPLIFFTHPATTATPPLSLHDALPISICTSRFRHATAARACRVSTSRFDRSISTLGSCGRRDRKSTRLNSSHVSISYAVFCLKKKTCRTSEWSKSPPSERLPHGQSRDH